MQTVQAIIMGACQGLTEFLPVSSSGHIVLASAVYKLFTGESASIVTNEEIFFDILIHLSTLFAVLIYFYKDIKEIVSGFFRASLQKNFNDENFKYGIYILQATFITCVMGFFLKSFAHKLTENPFIVCLFLIFTGFILYFSEKFKNKDKKIDFKTSLFVGFFQGLAVLPGVSRSGMTISSAVFKGVNRTDAAKFSFILSVPIILIASLIYPLLTFDLSEIKTFNFSAIALGMVVSFVVGYICIKYFMKFLKNHTLRLFSIYCISIGVIGALIFFVQG